MSTPRIKMPSTKNETGRGVQLGLPLRRRRTFVLGRVERPLRKWLTWRRVSWLGGAWLALGFAAVGAMAAHSWLQTTPAFGLVDVQIAGNKRASREELLRYLSVQPGDNMFALGLDALRANVLRHPWIKSATLRRELPATLRLEVSEHEARGMVSLGSLYLVDDDGEVFARAPAEATAEFSAITGLSREMYESDRGEWNRLLSLAFSFADAARDASLSLGEVHVDDTLGVTAYLLPNGVPAAFGHGDFGGKLERLKKTRSILQRNPEQQIEAFLLDNERHPEWVVARVSKSKTASMTAAR